MPGLVQSATKQRGPLNLVLDLNLREVISLQPAQPQRLTPQSRLITSQDQGEEGRRLKSHSLSRRNKNLNPLKEPPTSSSKFHDRDQDHLARRKTKKKYLSKIGTNITWLENKQKEIERKSSHPRQGIGPEFFSCITLDRVFE
jgi:hypothetical protein